MEKLFIVKYTPCFHYNIKIFSCVNEISFNRYARTFQNEIQLGMNIISSATTQLSSCSSERTQAELKQIKLSTRRVFAISINHTLTHIHRNNIHIHNRFKEICIRINKYKPIQKLRFVQVYIYKFAQVKSVIITFHCCRNTYTGFICLFIFQFVLFLLSNCQH